MIKNDNAGVQLCCIEMDKKNPMGYFDSTYLYWDILILFFYIGLFALCLCLCLSLSLWNPVDKVMTGFSSRVTVHFHK